MRRSAALCIGGLCLLLLQGGPWALHATAQSRPSASPLRARPAAEEALRTGRYEDVERLTAEAGADDSLLLIRARAARATGDYETAQSLLGPSAERLRSGDAALELGLLQLYRGQRPQGRRTLEQVMLGAQDAVTASDLARAARAARALGRFEDANALFRDAARLTPEDPVINTAWGELFLEKFNTAEATQSFSAALMADPTHVDAQLGMARALADENPPESRQLLERVLAVNPRHTDALTHLAAAAIQQDRKAEAREWLAKALAVNPKSREALALEGGLAYVEGRTEDLARLEALVRTIHPADAEFHRTLGEVTAGYYRFEEAATHVRRALQLDREHWRAYADLGANLMRIGDETGARRMLEMAFRQDPYDVVTFNLLGVLDALEKFGSISSGPLVIRLHEDESPVMSHYVPALAREAFDTLSRTWEFTPAGPILVEMFPRHDDFAVRNLGLPGLLGALGACFGKVVTLDSPKARPPGDFNWGATLWHEMAHVITLQLSGQRVPRWLTEGISTFEEVRAGRDWGREMDVTFARALEAGKVFPLADLNSGFTNPETISLAYFQSSLIVEHIVERFGQPRLRALVQVYATGVDTDEAVTKVLGVTLDDLQTSFTAFLDGRYRRLRQVLKAPDGLETATTVEALEALARRQPDSFPVQMALGEALRPSQPARALVAFEKAAALVPNAPGDENPLRAVAEVAQSLEQPAKAIAALDTLGTLDPAALTAARTLATLVDRASQPQVLERALRRSVAVDPFDAPSHTTLGQLAMADNRHADAVRAFRIALAARPVDRAGAHADLAEALLATGEKTEARRQVMAALELAPTYPRAQELLIALSGGR
jgi:tetratricopeptide (TPR) repeat protein